MIAVEIEYLLLKIIVGGRYAEWQLSQAEVCASFVGEILAEVGGVEEAWLTEHCHIEHTLREIGNHYFGERNQLLNVGVGGDIDAALGQIAEGHATSEVRMQAHQQFEFSAKLL